MALQPKTFRTSDDVIKALKDKATELDISESDIINKALRCFLGLGIDKECNTSQTELNILKNRIEGLIRLNNLKEA
ncbi:hypothetical protein [Nostoc sp. NMS8]|uniref:hypothetical protein n=1 Tax=Nostoc sp. NMS8 TaxID=2815392 RepID=UPI0025F41861|nr:hypothetical protein [Nostoc sp. NMS8]MBN3957397.1 hypothetical protein [Nostoc sp. NMS8]